MKNLIALMMFYSSLSFAGETSFLVQEDAAAVYQSILLEGSPETIEVGENVDLEALANELSEDWDGSNIVRKGLKVTTVENQEYRCSQFTNFYFGREDYMKRVNLYNWTINKDFDRPVIIFDGSTWYGGTKALTEFDYVCYTRIK